MSAARAPPSFVSVPGSRGAGRDGTTRLVEKMDAHTRYQLVMVRIADAHRGADDERRARLSQRTGFVTRSRSLDVFSRLSAFLPKWVH